MITVSGSGIVPEDAVILAENITYRGVPARGVMSYYDDIIKFIAGASDTAYIDGAPELIIRNSYGIKGMFCLPPSSTYRAPPRTTPINAANYAFTSISITQGAAGMATTIILTGTYTGYPVVSVRCNLATSVDSSQDIIGPWYTPVDASDLKCIIPADAASVTAYKVTIDVMYVYVCI